MGDASYIALMEYISNQIKFYLSIIFIPTGLILNLFSMFIYRRRKFRNNQTAFLSSWLILFETISLIFGFLIFTYLPTIGIDLYTKSNYICKLLSFSRRMGAQCASWSQATCTLDRFLTLKFLNKFNLLKNKVRNMVIITIIMLISLSIINIGNIFYRLDYVNKNNKTQVSCSAAIVVLFTTDLISILLRNILPFVLMMILNVIITIDFVKLKSKFDNKKGNKRQLQFTFTIICMNFISFVFYTPLSVVYVILNVYKLNPSISPVQIAKIQFAYNITTTVSFIYNALPFFINFAFNKLFRIETKVVIKNCLFIDKQPRRQRKLIENLQ